MCASACTTHALWPRSHPLVSDLESCSHGLHAPPLWLPGLSSALVGKTAARTRSAPPIAFQSQSWVGCTPALAGVRTHSCKIRVTGDGILETPTHFSSFVVHHGANTAPPRTAHGCTAPHTPPVPPLPPIPYPCPPLHPAPVALLAPSPSRACTPSACLRSQRLSAIEAMLLNLGQRIDAK